MNSLALVLDGRNLGDSVLCSRFVRRLAERRFARRYLVWTRPPSSFLFESLPDCDVVQSEFPMGTAKRLDARSMPQFLRAVMRIRKARPSVSIDLIGDFRERLLARLAGSSRHLHIGWAADHPFSNIIRNPFGPGHPAFVASADPPNVYAAHDAFVDALAPPRPETGSPPVSSAPAKPLRIGLHPFASQPCKLWPVEKWQELARELEREGHELSAFGAPHERPQLGRIFEGLVDEERLITVALPDFAKAIARLDVVIGLDSVSIHMAESQGIASVMINAGNPPGLWTPPRGTGLASSGGCAFYPCYNVPRCEGGSGQYACVRSIGVSDVVRAVGEGPQPSGAAAAQPPRAGFLHG